MCAGAYNVCTDVVREDSNLQTHADLHAASSASEYSRAQILPTSRFDCPANHVQLLLLSLMHELRALARLWLHCAGSAIKVAAEVLVEIRTCRSGP